MISAVDQPTRVLREPSWNISGIVAELGKLRNASLAARQRTDQQTKMPSRKALVEIVEGLTIALFPNRLGRADLAGEGVDYFVAHTLDVTLRDLHDQILLELEYSAALEGNNADQRQSAVKITREFSALLPSVRKLIESDLRAAFDGDPAARSEDEVLVCYPGIAAIIHHRLAHNLFVLGVPLVARLIAEIAHSATGIDIHPGAQIRGSFFIDHGTGVVVGETAVIGERVRLYQAVTLGAKRFPTDENGVLLKGNARHPIVEDDVVIYAGATILGRITVGKGSSIGGNVWLTQSVPPGSHVTQAKVRSEVFDGGGGI
jgi:serine O-acetyltransferase